MSLPLDPLAVVADFVDRVAPYDPAAGGPPVALMGVRTADGAATFLLTDHVARALCRALGAYRDPADRGRCAECGSRRIDDNLHCRDCGRLHGILGEAIAHQARRVAQATRAARAEHRAAHRAAHRAEGPARAAHRAETAARTGRRSAARAAREADLPPAGDRSAGAAAGRAESPTS